MNFILTLFFFLAVYAEEANLIRDCQSKNLVACQKLGDLYFEKADWNNAFLIGEALCKSDIFRSCMIAGSSLLAQNKTKEALPFLNLACDEFEPLACRSLGRLMKKGGEQALSHMYFIRSCQYGLKDMCSQLHPAKSPYSEAAKILITQIQKDCADTRSAACSDNLNTVKTCSPPLNRLDCQLMAGYLSILFRAKIMQEEAKVLLYSLHAQQKSLKETPESRGYSYDLVTVQKGAKELDKYHYVFGFMKNCGKKYLRSRKPVTNSLQNYPNAYKHLGARLRANISTYFTKGKAEDCYDSKSGYEAYAVTNLDLTAPSRLDVWMIDQDGRLKHVQDGLPLP